MAENRRIAGLTPIVRSRSRTGCVFVRFSVISWIGLNPTRTHRLCVRCHSRKARTPFSKSADLL